MKKILLMLALVLLPLVFTSCKDDENPTDSGGSGNYMITAQGSYWIQSKYKTDSLGNVKEDTRYSSTITADSTMMYKGKNATGYTDVDADGSTIMYFASEGKVVFQESRDFDFLLGLQLSGIQAFDPSFEVPEVTIGADWVKVADGGSSNWNIATINLNDVKFKYDGRDVVMDSKYEITGEKGGTTKITINGTEYTAQEFSVNMPLTGKLYTKIFSPKDEIAKISITMKYKYWFVEGVGLVKTSLEPVTTKVIFNSTIKAIVPNIEDINIVAEGAGMQTTSFKLK